MPKNYNRVSHLSRKASSVSHTGKIAYEIPKICSIELKKSIEPKIRQNRRERIASIDAAAHYIVGEK